MAVREMGRKSESMSWAGEDLGTGETLADFHKEGTKRRRRDRLKMEVSGRHKVDTFSRRNHDDISSGPAAEWSLVESNTASVSSTDMMNSGG
jgi:hypothetical protein